MQIRSSKYTVYVLDTVVKSRQILIQADYALVPWEERHAFASMVIKKLYIFTISKLSHTASLEMNAKFPHFTNNATDSKNTIS